MTTATLTHDVATTATPTPDDVAATGTLARDDVMTQPIDMTQLLAGQDRSDD